MFLIFHQNYTPESTLKVVCVTGFRILSKYHQENQLHSKHLVEFYEMLSSIRVEDENIFPLERSDDVYTGSVYSVGKDIDAGRYSLVGYSKDAAYLFLDDNCVVGQKSIPVNDIVNAGSQDVYLVDGMLVTLVSDCALIKYE